MGQALFAMWQIMYSNAADLGPNDVPLATPFHLKEPQHPQVTLL